MPIDAEKLVQVIQQEMPGGAEINVVPGIGAIKVVVAWKLNNDPERPNKMSKTISICVSHEAVQDFASASGSAQTNAYGRVTKFLSEKLAYFNPDHDTPRYEPPPVEQWLINYEVLVGK